MEMWYQYGACISTSCLLQFSKTDWPDMILRRNDTDISCSFTFEIVPCCICDHVLPLMDFWRDQLLLEKYVSSLYIITFVYDYIHSLLPSGFSLNGSLELYLIWGKIFQAAIFRQEFCSLILPLAELSIFTSTLLHNRVQWPGQS